MRFEDAYEDFKIYASKRHKKQGFETLSRNFNLHILPYFKGKFLNELNKNNSSIRYIYLPFKIRFNLFKLKKYYISIYGVYNKDYY